MCRILVSGDRNWKNVERIVEVFNSISETYKDSPHYLMHGDCQGLDKLAAQEAKKKGWQVLARPANWTLHGKAAGPIRNKEMLIEHQPDLLICFHDNISQSKGTKHMLTEGKKMQIKELWLVTSDNAIKYL